MNRLKWGFIVDGPHKYCALIESKPGVYIINCGDDKDENILDIGEAENLQGFLCASARPEVRFKRDCVGKHFLYSAIYLPNMKQDDRRKIADKIIDQVNPKQNKSGIILF
ncbi:MAG: hypothetical protein Kow0098_03430 [Ignavibacteriaceae bacterium]